MIKLCKQGVLISFLAVIGCAEAERFGTSENLETVFFEVDVECKNNADCWDDNHLTIDVCENDGFCSNQFVSDETNTDLVPSDDDCFFSYELFDDFLSSQAIIQRHHILQNIFHLTHTTSINAGNIIKLSIKQKPRRLFLKPNMGTPDDVLLVLLRDCLNTSFNRITWGSSIFSEELSIGDYYLAVFSRDGKKNVNVNAMFLDQTHCADAETIQQGLTVGTTYGLADDFNGSCLAPNHADGHRGDKVYKFTVPENNQWDVTFRLVSPANSEMHYWMYLKSDCGDPTSKDLECANLDTSIETPYMEGTTSDVVDGNSPQDRTSDELIMHSAKLESGTYYLYIDTVFPDYFDAPVYELTMNISTDSDL